MFAWRLVCANAKKLQAMN